VGASVQGSDGRSGIAALLGAAFVVIDVETTGLLPTKAAITEVGAARFQAGRLVATFRSFADPGCVVPSDVTALTGITDEMLRGAPPPWAVGAQLTEFARNAVLVGHNLPFDVAFLVAALEGAGTASVGANGCSLPELQVDTLVLARRLLGPEVPNFRLATLATCLGLAHQPTHRALGDAFATASLLFHLIGRATLAGVATVEELAWLASP
jgi:DNA polymerase-3 subunit epsilon